MCVFKSRACVRVPFFLFSLPGLVLRASFGCGAMLFVYESTRACMYVCVCVWGGGGGVSACVCCTESIFAMVENLSRIYVWLLLETLCSTLRLQFFLVWSHNAKQQNDRWSRTQNVLYWRLVHGRSEFTDKLILNRISWNIPYMSHKKKKRILSERV